MVQEIITQPEDFDAYGKQFSAEKKFFDLEELVPIELIRTHTKTDDVPHVTDEQLRLYRKTAFESAMQYSGLYLGKKVQIIEAAKIRVSRTGFAQHRRRHRKHKLDYPAAEPVVYVWSNNSASRTTLHIDTGTRIVLLPIHQIENPLASCCSPCGNEFDQRSTLQLMYVAGYSCVDDVPAGIVLGILKYIAWSVMRPGDELLTIRNRTSVEEGGLRGTNNAAWASGALELWMQYNDDRF